jgi:hypothetical protein
MSKIPVYVCNRKRCKDGACAICHNTSDIEYAERDIEGNPVVAYYWYRSPFRYPGDTWSGFKEVKK